jgi:hypothetical protein
MSLIESLAEFAGTMSFKIKNALGIEPAPWPFPPADLDHEIAQRLVRKGCLAPIADINGTKADFCTKEKKLFEVYRQHKKIIEQLKLNIERSKENTWFFPYDENKINNWQTELVDLEAKIDAIIEEQHKLIEELNIKLQEVRTRKEITSDEEWNALLKESAEKHYIGFFIPLPKRKPDEHQG